MGQETRKQKDKVNVGVGTEGKKGERSRKINTENKYYILGPHVAAA